MNRLVKRGLSAYKIFLKNKFMASFMMFIFGIMMFIAALNGKGNDTWTLPIIITILGAILSLWAAYRLGYIKSSYNEAKKQPREERTIRKKELVLQFCETAVYIIITGLGVFLLTNQSFTDKILNLMAGFFTTLNGVLGAINTYKARKNIDFHWKFVVVLTLFELILGPYFIIASDSIDINSYIVMGMLTMVAGVAEIISASTKENLKETLDDGKKMANIIRNGKENPESDQTTP
ncbi:DUF308 domain-containing protein [Candidatus Saccharibacteria bacterium]|nr:DUF308 domain-containing protein [Candidatus Saccharibacteria bacterium]